MPRRPALVTQADVTRTIRAMQSLGLEIAAVVVRPDGVSVETKRDEAREKKRAVEEAGEIVL